MSKQTNDDWLSLHGKNAVITGAGSGIGRATALEFARAGARTFLLDINVEQAQETESIIAQEAEFPTHVLGIDVASDAAVAETLSQVRELAPHVDALVNAAGRMGGASLDELPTAKWDAVMNIDLAGVLRTSRAFKGLMRAGGSLVHISSVAGSHPVALGGAYSSAKAGVTMLSRQMAVEWGPEGIRSNTISPGYVRTPMTNAIYTAEGVLEQRESRVPLRRLASVDEIANAILFLASPKSSYVTGQDLLVDGGLAQTVMLG